VGELAPVGIDYKVQGAGRKIKVLKTPSEYIRAPKDATADQPDGHPSKQATIVFRRGAPTPDASCDRHVVVLRPEADILQCRIKLFDIFLDLILKNRELMWKAAK